VKFLATIQVVKIGTEYNYIAQSSDWTTIGVKQEIKSAHMRWPIYWPRRLVYQEDLCRQTFE